MSPKLEDYSTGFRAREFSGNFGFTSFPRTSLQKVALLTLRQYQQVLYRRFSAETPQRAVERDTIVKNALVQYKNRMPNYFIIFLGGPRVRSSLHSLSLPRNLPGFRDLRIYLLTLKFRFLVIPRPSSRNRQPQPSIWISVIGIFVSDSNLRLLQMLLTAVKTDGGFDASRRDAPHTEKKHQASNDMEGGPQQPPNRVNIDQQKDDFAESFGALGLMDVRTESRVLPDELVEEIFDWLDTLLNKRDFLHLVQVCRRFRLLAIPYLYQDLEFSEPRRFFDMWEAWSSVPMVFLPCVTSLSLGDTLTDPWTVEFNPFWKNIADLAYSMGSLRLLALNRLNLSFDFFEFAKDLKDSLSLQLDYCLVNREALLAVPSISFHRISLTMISWQENSTSPIQKGGQIIAELILRCRSVLFARYCLDQSLIFTDWPETRQDQELMGLTITRIIRDCSLLDYLSLPNSAKGFVVLREYVAQEAKIRRSKQLFVHAQIEELEAPPQLLSLIHPSAGMDILDISDAELTPDLMSGYPIMEFVKNLTFAMADISTDDMDYLHAIFPGMQIVMFKSLRNSLTTWTASSIRVLRRENAATIRFDKKTFVDILRQRLSVVRVLRANDVCFNHVYTYNSDDRSDYSDRESLIWVMVVGFSNLPIEQRPEYLRFVMALWSERFPEDLQGGRPNPGERTTQPMHAELPSIDLSVESVIHFIEESAKAIEDCFQQAIKAARGCLKLVQPERCLEELHIATYLWDIHHRLPLNVFASDLALLLPPPYEHLTSTPHSSNIHFMHWFYPMRGFDMEKFDDTVLEVEECILESKAFLEYYRHEIPAYLVHDNEDISDNVDHHSSDSAPPPESIHFLNIHMPDTNSSGSDTFYFSGSTELYYDSVSDDDSSDADVSSITAYLNNLSDSDESSVAASILPSSSPILSSDDATIAFDIDDFLTEVEEVADTSLFTEKFTMDF
ncbi:hypothetical protein C8J55DRAFT_493094 [Lentinula edodes]|uniref:F-box domain-containing protein n=1 Tax=Lentinula lateritia TaxID=40482 RepID=A0A9W8ZUY8_9AGAR|nr:hypothetical protein C8J55DRAFT_493094 [Lentinula edodes]